MRMTPIIKSCPKKTDLQIVRLFAAFLSFADVRSYGLRQYPFRDQKLERLDCLLSHGQPLMSCVRRRAICFDFFPNIIISEFQTKYLADK